MLEMSADVPPGPPVNAGSTSREDAVERPEVSNDPDTGSVPSGGSQASQVASAMVNEQVSTSQTAVLLSPELLRQIQLLQSPEAQAMLQQLQGGSQEEDGDPTRISVIAWAKSYLPDMIATSSQALPGSFALQEGSSSSSLLRGDDGVMGAFLRGLNMHRAIPKEAQLPVDIIRELKESVPVLGAQKYDQHIRPLRPINGKFFQFSDPALAFLLSKDALMPRGVVPHQDWGNAQLPTTSCPQWKRTSDGLAFMLEAAALVDLLITLEGETVPDHKAQMLRNLRNLIVSTSTVLGSQGHELLMSRREQILERFGQPNRQALLQEPFLPGQILGAQAKKQLEEGRDPVQTILHNMPRRPWFPHPRGRGGPAPFRPPFQPRFPFNIRGAAARFSSPRPRGGGQQAGSSRGAPKRPANFGVPNKKKRF